MALERGKRRPHAALKAPRAAQAVCCAVVLACASAAFASGFYSGEFGGERGNVVTTDPTAIYFNPAGLALSNETRLFVAGVGALRRGSWTRGPASEVPPPGAEGADSGTARFSNLLGAPALVLTATVFDRLAIGAGLYAPFGGAVHWDKNPHFLNHPSFPRAADGVQRWHSIDGSVSSIYGTLGAAMRFGPLALGASGNVIRSALHNTFAKSLNPQQLVDVNSEGRIAIDVSGLHFSVGLGAMLEAIPGRIWLGASYQAQPGFGPMKMDGTVTITEGDNVVPVDATFTQGLPDIVRAGARFRVLEGVRPLELRLFGNVTRWSRMQTQCVSKRGQPCAVYTDGSDATPAGTTIQNLRRSWNDTYGVNVGASYWATNATELFVGVGFETAAAPDATLDPSLGDAPNMRTAIGGRFALPGRLFVSTTLTNVRYTPRDNTGKSTLSEPQFPTRRPDGGGQHRLWLGMLQVSMEKHF